MPSRTSATRHATRHPTSSTYVGTIGGIRCHISKLAGTSLNDTNSNWRLWNADTKVFNAGQAASEGREEDGEVFESRENMLLARADRVRKATIWFTVSEELRTKHLLDLGGRESTSDDVWKRLHERLGGGYPFEPLPELKVEGGGAIG